VRGVCIRRGLRVHLERDYGGSKAERAMVGVLDGIDKWSVKGRCVKHVCGVKK
jgi:hypothetical protein